MLACCLVVSTQAAPPGDPKGPSAAVAKQEVLDLGKEWVLAEQHHDLPTLRRILDDKFVFTFGAGKSYDRDGYLKLILGGDADPTESQTLTDQTVLVDGDTAVEVGTDAARWTEGGAAQAKVYRYTVTYIRRQGRWRALAEHTVEAPPPKPQAN